MSSERDANALATSQGNDDGKGKSPVLNGGNQENAEKKSDGDVSESVKALVRATMAEELAKLKAGSGQRKQHHRSPVGHRIAKVSNATRSYLFQGRCLWDYGDNHFPLFNRRNSKAWGLVKNGGNLKERCAPIQTNEGPSGEGLARRAW